MQNRHPKEYKHWQLEKLEKGDRRVKIQEPVPSTSLENSAASGPQKVLGEGVEVGDANSPVEPKPAKSPPVEPKPPKPKEQVHHPEAPQSKRLKRNLQTGDTIQLSPDVQHELEGLLREVTSSMDLGIVTRDGITRLSPQNQQSSELLRVLNTTMRDLLGSKHFRWTSIRIDKNSITRPRIVTTHAGPSVHLMMGDFKGGTFRTIDGMTKQTEPNQLLAFDPPQTTSVGTLLWN